MRIPQESPQPTSPGKRVTLVGAGLTGSNVGPLLARLRDVTHVRVIDADIFTLANLACQAITAADVGRLKVEVLSRRIRQIAPHIKVEPLNSWVEHVPLSLLRADVVLSCPDSRRARRVINEACWRLGVPLIDSGVDGAGLLARTNVYVPGPGRPCLECSWDEVDYAALEQVYACLKGVASSTATNATGSLGCIAAGQLVSVVEQFLAGDPGDAECRQVLWDCLNHRCLVTQYRCNPGCRFDHEIWDIEELPVAPGTTPLGRFFELLGTGNGAARVAIRLAGQQFVSRLVCSCGAVRDKCLYLDRALTPARLRCTSCSQPMAVSGFHATEWLSCSTLPSGRHMRRSMASIGFRQGDVVSVRQAEGCRHIELVGPEVSEE